MSLLLLFDSAKSSRASVLRGSDVVGTLERTDRGAAFQYSSEYVDGHNNALGRVAYNMPVQREPFVVNGTNLHPFFAGLLPEGLRFNALTQHVKTSKDDLMSLLIAAGPDTIGDIHVVPKQFEKQPINAIVEVEEISDVRFEDLWVRSVNYGGDALREYMSVSGVHRKVSASMISFPVRGVRKKEAHILKLGSSNHPNIVENELFFMRMASDCGVPCAELDVVHDADGEAGLLVKRFDRVAGQGEEPVEVHQEDGCQFLDRYPGDKYLLSLADIARGLDEWCDVPVLAVAALVRLQAFSYLIANGDLHAKNISLRTNPDTNRVEPTPAYDLLSTWPYGDQRMALKLDGRDARLNGKHFVEFAKRFGVGEKATRATLEELCDKSRKWIPRLEEIGFDRKKIESLTREMEARTKQLSAV